MFFKRKHELSMGEFKLANHKLEMLSILTCPACGFKRIAAILTPASNYRFQCSRCQAVNVPIECCVFCSYGSVGCPEKQQAG